MRVSFKTFGCRLNQYDTEWLREEVELAGFKTTCLTPKDIINCVPHRQDVCAIEDDTDVCVINTCTVTGKTCRQARKVIRAWARRSPKPFIIVTGCYAKISPRELSQIDGIDLIEPDPKKIATDFLEVLLLSGIKNFSEHDKAFVKVQEGCDQFCSYCIVPYARGKPRDRPIQEILQEVGNLIKNGYQEFVLTGTNLGKCKNLLNIVKSIELLSEVRRLGLGSIEPLGISDELLEFIGNSKKCGKYFHIPLQSGDNKILESMRRWYTREEYEALLHRIKEKVPDSAIGADVIVGFPGESETEFLNTYNLIASSPISRLHIFRYSKRPMTQALNLKNEPQDIIKKKRSKILRELGEKKWLEFRTTFIDRTLEAHIEKTVNHNANGWLIGVTPNYIKVLLEKQSFYPPPQDRLKSSLQPLDNQKVSSAFVNLRIKKIDGSYTYGELVK